MEAGVSNKEPQITQGPPPPDMSDIEAIEKAIDPVKASYPSAQLGRVVDMLGVIARELRLQRIACEEIATGVSMRERR